MRFQVDPGILRSLFAVLAVLSTLVAAGVMKAPQFAAPITAVSNVKVDGASLGAESVIWQFNPDMNMIHFELSLSNVSNYQVTAYVPSPLRFNDAKATYEVQPFTMRFDLSDLRTAVPMQEARLGQKIVRYVYSDCTLEVDPQPASILEELLNVISIITGVQSMTGLSLKQISDTAEFKRILNESWQKCRGFYKTYYPQSRVYVFLGVQSVKRSVVVPFLNISLSNYDFPKPDFFAVVETPVETYVPRVTGEVYPVGSVKFYLMGSRGTYGATVVINRSDLNSSVIEKEVSSSLGNIFFSFYALKSGDLFKGKGDPIVFKWPDKLRYAFWNDLSQAENLKVNLLNYIESSTSEARDLYIGSIDSITSVGIKLASTFGEGVTITQNVKAKLQQMVNSYNSAVVSVSQAVQDSPGVEWDSYVLILPDNPVDSHYMLLRFVGDIKASYLGLKYLKATPKISDLRVLSNPTDAQPLKVSVTVRNLEDKEGSVSLTVSCDRLGTAQDWATLPASGTVERTITLYQKNYTEQFIDTCRVVVCNVDYTACDEKMFTAQYAPIKQCEPNTSWCSDDGTAIEICKDPYKGTIDRIPCAEGETCAMEFGAAKCVSKPKQREVNDVNKPSANCYCKGGGLLCFNPDVKKFEFKPCPEGQLCVATPEGAKCEGIPTPPPKPKEYQVTFIERDTGVRIGFALMAVGFVLLAVIM